MSQEAQFTVTADGVPVVINPSAQVQVQFTTFDGTPLTKLRAVSSSEDGANWAAGLVVVDITDEELALLTPPAVIAVIVGPGIVKRFKLDIVAPNVMVKSKLFVKDIAVDEIRKDRLLLLAQGILPGYTPSDDYLWLKLVAAESETGSDLRVPLVPTQFYPDLPPTPAQVAIANPPAGMPIERDVAYDYDPDFFQGEKWGFMVFRNKPLIKVQQILFAYPAPTVGIFEFPLDWFRIDYKYGQLRMVPATSTFVAPLNAFLLQALGGGRTIPYAFNVTYQAGIDAYKDYPQLIDLIKRRAVLKIIEDGFLPSSGSISADGLSQSLSINMEQYRDMIDVTLNGPKGSNGGLMTAIHGIKMFSMGS